MRDRWKRVWYNGMFKNLGVDKVGKKINIRGKGQRAERESIKILKPIVDKIYSEFDPEPPLLERNQQQSNQGGYDIIGLDWLALEVKHQETFNLNGWWKQTWRQAQAGQYPVLMYKRNYVKFRVRMVGLLACHNNTRATKALVDISLDDFLVWFECELRERVSELKPF